MVNNETNTDTKIFSTPLDKENERNACNRVEKNMSPLHAFGRLSELKLSNFGNVIKPKKPTAPTNVSVNGQLNSSKNTAKYVSGDIRPSYLTSDVQISSNKFSPPRLEPRELLFSPIESLLKPKNHVKNISTPQPIDSLFATPSIKPPLTTGRIIFSSSQQKQRKPLQPALNYQKTLFTTPQSIASRPLISNTSDYVTDSFNSFRRTPIVFTYLSPIEEEKITIEDLIALSKTCDNGGSALLNKVIEINRKDFILKNKIGSGGSSIVFLAHRKDIGKDCALKVVNLIAEESIAQSYLNETKLLEKLQGSDCVVKLFE